LSFATPMGFIPSKTWRLYGSHRGGSHAVRIFVDESMDHPLRAVHQNHRSSNTARDNCFQRSLIPVVIGCQLAGEGAETLGLRPFTVAAGIAFRGKPQRPPDARASRASRPRQRRTRTGNCVTTSSKPWPFPWRTGHANILRVQKPSPVQPKTDSHALGPDEQGHSRG